jgi:hypothetical protein
LGGTLDGGAEVATFVAVLGVSGVSRLILYVDPSFSSFTDP